jgi:hypothetical protein
MLICLQSIVACDLLAIYEIMQSFGFLFDFPEGVFDSDEEDDPPPLKNFSNPVKGAPLQE